MMSSATTSTDLSVIRVESDSPAVPVEYVLEDARAVAAAWLLSLRSDNTRAAYRRELDTFRQWIGDQIDTDGWDNLLAVARPGVDAYRLHLASAGSPVTSQARAISAVRSFYAYAAEVGAVPASPAERVSPPKVATVGRTPGLSVAEMGALLRAARDSSITDYALVLLLATTALRISEALALDVDTLTTYHDPVDGRDYWRALVTRKGGDQDWVTVPDAVCDALLQTAVGRTSGPLFATSSGRRLDRTGAWKRMRTIARAAGIPKLAPHMLRVAAITTALAQPGAQLHRVQDMAGHRDPRTTRRYDREANSARTSPSHALAPLILAAETSE